MAKYDFNGTTTSTSSKYNFDAPTAQIKPATPFAATKAGITLNTILGLPKAALKVGADLLHLSKPAATDVLGNTLAGLPQATADVAHDITRSFASTGLATVNATKIAPYQPEIPKPDPSDKVGTKVYNFLYGSGDVKDLSTKVVEYEQNIKNSPTAKKLGLDKFALPLAFGTVVGSATLDLIPGGAGEDNAIKTLAKETTEEGVLNLLKKLGVKDEIAKSFAPKFAETSDVTVTKDLLDTMKSVHGAAVFDSHINGTSQPQISDEAGFFKSKTSKKGVQSFTSIPEKNTMPAQIKDGLDTFVVKEKDGTYAVIEGKSGLQIGESADNIPDALTSAKSAVEKMPNVEDVIAKQAISPRYKMSDVPFGAELTMTSKADRLASETGLAERDLMAARETEKKINKFGANTEEIRKGIDDFNTRIAALSDQVDSHSAKDLWNKIKSVAKVNFDTPKPTFDTSLAEINQKALSNPKASETAKKLDDIVKEFGYKDTAEAQKGVETWLNARQTLKDLKETRAGMVRDYQATKTESTDKLSIEKFLNKSAQETERMIAERDSKIKLSKRSATQKAVDAEAEAARLKGYDEHITKENGGVIPPEGRGGLKPPELRFNKWKDKEALSLNRETMERNLEKVAGEDAPKVKSFLVDHVRSNETKRVQFVNDLNRKIKKTVVKDLGIRAGSLEDQLVQKVGEKTLTIQEREALLKTRKGKKIDWEKINKAAGFFRQQYDTLLERVNTERAKYGYAPIPKRADYFRHFQEIGNAIHQFGLILREQDLPTEIAGITGIFNPGKPFSTAELRRKGLSTTLSAVKGFENYLGSISKQIYHIDSVQRGRVLEKYIRETAKAVSDSKIGLDALKLPHFVANLHDYTNILAGKKSALDRSVEALLGRKIYGIANWFSNKSSANMLGANVSSALTNFAPFVQSLATTSKMPAIRGLGSALMHPLVNETTPVIGGVTSGFLTRRFPEEFIDLTGSRKAKEYAGSIFKLVDSFVSRSVVAGKYYELVGKGVSKESAMKAADEYAGRVLADRSLGNLPNLFNSKSLKPFTQFQVEVNNIYSFLKHDIPHMNDHSARKIASAIGQFVVYSYMFNNAYQKVTGRRPILDPIYTATSILGLNDETKGTTISSRLKVAGKDVAGNIPFTAGLGSTGRYPTFAGVPDLPAIFAGTTTWTKELAKPLIYYASPLGGGQIQKSYKGIKAYLAKKVTSASGKTDKYKVKQTPSNLLKAVLFGPAAFPETQKFYANQTRKAGTAKKGGSSKYSF